MRLLAALACLCVLSTVVCAEVPVPSPMTALQREELNQLCALDDVRGLSGDPSFGFCLPAHHGVMNRTASFQGIRDRAIAKVIAANQYGLSQSGDAFFQELVRLPKEKVQPAFVSYFEAVEEILHWSASDFDGLLAHMRTAIAAQAGAEKSKQTLNGLVTAGVFQPASSHLRAMKPAAFGREASRFVEICGIDGHGESALSYQSKFKRGLPSEYGVVFCPGALFRAGHANEAEKGFSRPDPRLIAIAAFHELGHILGGHTAHRFYEKLLPYAKCINRGLTIGYKPEDELSIGMESIADEWGIQAMIAMIQFERELKGDEAAAYEISRQNLSIYCHGNPLDFAHLNMTTRLTKILAPKVCRYFKSKTEHAPDACRFEL